MMKLSVSFFNIAILLALINLDFSGALRFFDPAYRQNTTSSASVITPGITVDHTKIHAAVRGTTRKLQSIPPEAPFTTTLLNPERGFYHHTESLASNPSPLDLTALQAVRQGGRTVLLRVYYLDTFLETDTISTEFLDQLVADFQTMLV